MAIVKVDPILYCATWSDSQPIDVPVRAQAWHVKQAIQAHAALLYDNPLTKALRPRERFRMLRKQLARYSKLVRDLGIIPALIELKRISHVFLQCFKTEPSGRVIFSATYDLRNSPLWGLFASLDGAAVSEVNVHVVHYCLTWHVYLAKLPLTRPDLEEPAQKAWIERQQLPPTVFLQTDIRPLRYIAGWLFELHPEFVGSHGPGSTSVGARTVPDKNAKYRRSYQTDSLLRYTPDEVLHSLSGRMNKRDSKYGRAEKDIGSVRPLTMMPPEEQFAQQGLKYDWYAQVDWIRECNLSKFVTFSDQEPSRQLALYGSRPHLGRKGVSTLDSKNASDLISVDLITEILSGDTLHYVMLARSWNCKVNKRTRIELSMYDGMGSALTFPVQTLIFTTVSVWATILMLTEDEPELSWQDRISTVLTPHGFKREYAWAERLIRTYGDDVILPVGATKYCAELLTRLGLVVNMDKSFIGDSPVRESCGMYAVAGYDVTPLRYRIPIQAEKSLADAAFFESAREHSNRALLNGFLQNHRILLKRVNQTKPFISGAERRKRVHCGKKEYTEYLTVDAPLLTTGIEEGLETLGFLSNVPTRPSTQSMVWVRLKSFTTLAARTVTVPDKGSDFYHLTLWWRRRELYRRDLLSDGELRVEFAGKRTIPRGIRLIKRNAIRTDRPISSGFTSAWEWAPR